MGATIKLLLLISLCGAGVLAGCADPMPSAENVTWAVERTEDRKGYRLSGTATVQKGFGGWYQPTATLYDDRGCRHVVATEEGVMDANTNNTDKVSFAFDEVFELRRPVASVDFQINYNDVPGLSTNAADIVRTNLFNESRILDSTVKIRDDISNPCNKSPSELRSRPERLRDRAKTDPDGADTEAIGSMSRNEVIATAINTAGFLCARVTDLYPSGGDIVATCVEYRSGQGQAKYRIDTSTMSVEKVE